MITYIYMVRHGDSPLMEGTERLRGLTPKGIADARRVTELLEAEGIEVFVSSPFQRAILTIQDLAQRMGKDIIQIEDLRERSFDGKDIRLPDETLMPLLEQSYADPSFALEGGESNQACQNRAIAVIRHVLTTHPGQRIAIGTHGAIMALIMGYYDKRYGLNFLLQASKPDIYKMEFSGQELTGIERLWGAPTL
ncbi:histidine phosphatase family protein [Paenibacillus sp. 1011MAR3C5]|uniref:histidine phosphatase family protein n=1 Tax=Paenibacillus sp. 1011MAR3C5 TaxID=1675787 RepID=UPI000E6D42BD|nr:histidine phosphatase family protein [Paenibacillus sp. 1011MAR3C5]RJE90628.1 histidine phosphatase family protein [Paenibacillus sp. 1011MAR3C5]